MSAASSTRADASRLAELLAPLTAEPQRAAVLLDVDGTLAPIVRHAADAQMSEATRSLLIAVARRYGLVACVSGRQAAEARRIVAIGSIAYIGSHGAELLGPGAAEAELDPELRAWMGRVQGFARRQNATELSALRVWIEDKGAIAAFHWRGAPDEAAARAAVEEIAKRAEATGLAAHWGRKVLEIRPPVPIDKGAGITALLRHHAEVATAVYAGDDATDLDAFRALRELVDHGRLEAAACVCVASDEGPAELAREADAVLEGPDAVRALLEALLNA